MPVLNKTLLGFRPAVLCVAASALYDVTNEEQANTRARSRPFLEGISAAVRTEGAFDPSTFPKVTASAWLPPSSGPGG